MSSMRFAEAFKFGFPWKAFASIANVSLGAAISKTLHLRGLRPHTSSPGALRLEGRAMPLLLDDNGRPLNMHCQLRMRDQWCGPHNAERLVGAAFPDTRSARSKHSGKSKCFISGRVYLSHHSFLL